MGLKHCPTQLCHNFLVKVSLLKSGMSGFFRMVKFTEFIATTVLIKDGEHHVFCVFLQVPNFAPMIPHAKVHGGTAAPAPRAPVPTRPLCGANREPSEQKSTGDPLE